MTGRLACALAALTLAGAAAAQEPPPQRMVTDAEAPAYAAVGRLNLTTRQYCTATLISDRLVLTAAHCVHHQVTRARVPPSEIRFVAGYRRGEYAALRGVAAVAILPGFEPTQGQYIEFDQIRRDLALLLLDEPIPADRVTPARIGVAGPDAVLWSVSYGEDRPEMASIREGCSAVDVSSGVMQLDCAFVAGGSGAPVFAAGPDGPELVAVLSATTGPKALGEHQGIAIIVAPVLDALRAALAAEASR